MLMAFYPTYHTEYGGFGISIFSYLASDSLEELKTHAASLAQERRERQFIVQWGDTYVLFGFSCRTLSYFQDRPIIARFAASGKETTPKSVSRAEEVV